MPTTGTYVRPTTTKVAHDYILDPRDLNQRIPPPPPGFEPVAANASWRVSAKCG